MEACLSRYRFLAREVDHIPKFWVHYAPLSCFFMGKMLFIDSLMAAISLLDIPYLSFVLERNVSVV